MTVVTLPYRTQLAAGKSEDIGMVMADFDAIVSAINGRLTNDNFNAAAALSLLKFNIGGTPTGAKFLSGNKSWDPLPSTSGVTKYFKNSATQVVNTTTKTDLFGGSFTIAQDAPTAGDVIKLWASGTYSNSSGADRTITLELALGGTPIWNGGVSDTIARNAGLVRCWTFEFTLQMMASQAAEKGTGVFRLGDTGTATTGTGILTGSTAPAVQGVVPESIDAIQDFHASSQSVAFAVTHSIALATVQMTCSRACILILRAN